MTAIMELCSGVIPFIWNRLPLGDASDIEDRTPCLAEDWFVDDALAAGSPFVWRGRGPETSHRFLYRYARERNIERTFEKGLYERKPERLLLHQMVLLIPALVAAALLPFASLKHEEKS